MQPLLQHYLEQFQSIPLQTSELWDRQRRLAMEGLVSGGFPSTKDEPWRYIARSLLLQQPFKVAKPLETQHALPSSLRSSLSVVRLVWIDGHLHLPSIKSLPKHINIMPMREVMQKDPQVLFEHGPSQTGFHALNTVFSEEGVSITIRDNCASPSHIECWYLSTPLSTGIEEAQMLCIRNHIQVGKHSMLRLGQYYRPFDKLLRPTTQASLCFNILNTVTLQAGSKMEWGQSTSASDQDVYVGQLAVQQHHDSLFHGESLVSGGGLVRQTTTVDLKEAGAHCQLYGLSGVKRQQQVDHHIVVRHHADHTYSDMHYRSIADDRGHASFSGEVIAQPAIRQMRSHQGNYNLLLSDAAEVYAKPRLALFTGDIECTHGATVGALDNAALFYLQTRGISEKTARLMLIQAFSQLIRDRMPVLTTTDNDLFISFLDFIKQSA